jgi:two-component system, chemotaxis family, chemotaxis protein CheY
MAEQIRALVIDDSPGMRRAIVYALQRMGGVHCVEAQDGVEGLKKLAAETFDIMMTDINMPMMDGLKLIGHVRKDPKNQAIPIIVITTESGVEDRSRAIALGASAYLVKPVQAKEVIQTVKKLLNLP